MVEMVCYFVTKQTLLKFTRPRAGSIKVTSESLVYQRVILKQKKTTNLIDSKQM